MTTDDADASRGIPRYRIGHGVGSVGRVSRGSALTEFVVLTIIMLPLLFGIPMIGKLIDVRQTTVQASRYAIWETTVGAPDAGPADVRARFFAERSAPIAGDGMPSGGNPLWGAAPAGAAAGARAGDGGTAVRIDEASVAALPYRDAREAGDDGSVAARTGEAVRASGRFLGRLSGADWDLSGDGLLRGGVRVDVEANDWLVTGPGGCASGAAYACLEEASVILGDGWSAGSEREAERRIKSLVPANALDRVGDAVAIAGRLPIFKELEGLDEAFGKVDVGRLPAEEERERPTGGGGRGGR